MESVTSQALSHLMAQKKLTRAGISSTSRAGTASSTLLVRTVVPTSPVIPRKSVRTRGSEKKVPTRRAEESVPTQEEVIPSDQRTSLSVVIPSHGSDGRAGCYGEGNLYISETRDTSQDRRQVLYRELSSYNIPDDIKREAVDIWLKTDSSIRRGLKRKVLHYHLISKAHKQMGRTFYPVQITSTIGINNNKISTPTTLLVDEDYDGAVLETDSNVVYTPQNYIRDQFRWTNLSEESLPQIIDLADQMLNKDPDLDDEKPQRVAAVIIQYFMTINGLDLKDEFYENIYVKKSTTNDLYNHIAELDNM